MVSCWSCLCCGWVNVGVWGTYVRVHYLLLELEAAAAAAAEGVSVVLAAPSKGAAPLVAAAVLLLSRASEPSRRQLLVGGWVMWVNGWISDVCVKFSWVGGWLMCVVLLLNIRCSRLGRGVCCLP